MHNIVIKVTKLYLKWFKWQLNIYFTIKKFLKEINHSSYNPTNFEAGKNSILSKPGKQMTPPLAKKGGYFIGMAFLAMLFTLVLDASIQ